MKRGKDLYRKLRRKKAQGYCMKCKCHYASLLCGRCHTLKCECRFPCCEVK